MSQEITHLAKVGEIVEYMSISLRTIYNAEVIFSRRSHCDISIITQSTPLTLTGVKIVPRDKLKPGQCSLRGAYGEIESESSHC